MKPTTVRTLVVAMIAVIVSTIAFAQDGVSTAGAARARYLGNLGIIPTAREVAVEDFVNYHRHEIGRPKAGETVGVDVRWGSASVAPNGEAILQVGLSTALVHDRQQLRPLNLSLVIDKSGSMADSDKLIRVKSALLTLVSQLRTTDVLSIVVFDSEAKVLLPASPVLDREKVYDLIRQIEPGTATNLCTGLMLGYKEALRNYRKDATNRVVLLTDGIANRGITEPKEIANASLSFNDRGIDLSTIGVGRDLNQDLLRDLAKAGRGLFHFVADSEDIEKVFVREVQSLVSPAATEPNLQIQYGPGLKLDKVYGYDPKLGPNTVDLKLDNMNSGMTEVVLVRFKPDAEEADSARLPVKIRLSYYDLDRKQQVVTTKQAFISVGSSARGEDDSVTKNYTIALLAQAIHDMAASCEDHRTVEAERLLSSAIDAATQRYPNLDDADIARTMATATKYRDALRSRNALDRESPVEQDRTIASGENLIFNGGFELGNTGFVSDLPYAAPTTNCLWGCTYTITPRFDTPQLHTLVSAEDYAAPGGRNHQVYFANAGGTGLLTLWSAPIRCKPNTTYRIEFQAISLTPGREWIPTFEIRLNGERSDPQFAGASRYARIAMTWKSGSATSATVSIVRLPFGHGGGIIGLTDIAMRESR